MVKKQSSIVFILAIVLLIILILAIVIFTNSGVRTYARLPGVSLGDTFTYDVTSFWNISKTNTTVPLTMLEINQTKSFRVTITNVTASLVTTLETWIFKNGTERNSTGLVNVETGYNSGGFWPVVAANLRKDDLLHPAGQNNITVNGTISREYPSGARETNYFTFNYQGVDDEFGYYAAEADYYFDRSTGMLVELYDSSTFLSTNAQGAILWKIKESNVWVVS